MHVVVLPAAEGAAVLQPVDEHARPQGAPRSVSDLASAVAEWERAGAPRWVWPSTAEVYPELLRAGVRVRRCHDLAAVEAILLARSGTPGAPRGYAAAYARLLGAPVPADPVPAARDTDQATLFEPAGPELAGGADPLDAAVAVLAAQQRELSGSRSLRLLAAAESAGALAAAEMTWHGLPWHVPTHLRLLDDLLGERPTLGNRPAKLAELVRRICAEFGRELNPDQPGQVVQAFGRLGFEVRNTRAVELRRVEHPVVAPLLEYKELHRLWVAHGWSWLESWVSDGRFRAEYVVGGVVSGRWATRGGAGLQLPRVLRTAVRAEPGHRLVVADAAQLEPRVLAALSGDARLAEVSAAGDLYTSLAENAFGADRHAAKVAMLSAMYGGSGGGASGALSVLRRRFPTAVRYVERAAAAGEAGETVRSRLGRTSPPPSEQWRAVTGAEPGQEPGPEVDAERLGRQAARNWGRFTRNFVVQASAADWALALLAALRLRLIDAVPAARLVFFQHDEVIVHVPVEHTAEVERHLLAAAAEAGELVFGDTAVRFPLQIQTVDCYADAK